MDGDDMRALAVFKLHNVVCKAKALVEAMDEIQNSGAYNSIWHIAAIHGAVYRGRQWVKEFGELKESIKNLEEK